MAARRKRRRQAYDQMKSERSRGAVLTSNNQRRAMTSNEIETFLQSIVKKRSSDFGLVKLRALNLNTLVTIPLQQQQQQHQYQHQHQIGEATSMTLLQFAASKQRYNIISQLLRGGADPRARWTENRTAACMKDTPQEYLSKFSLQYGLWICTRLAQMRVHTSMLAEETCCVLCSNRPVEPLRVHCRNNDDHNKLQYFMCEDCCWIHMQSLDPQCNKEALDFCPECSPLPSTRLTLLYGADARAARAAGGAGGAGGASASANAGVRISDLQSLLPPDISSTTLQKFNTLPVDNDDTTTKRGKQHGKLKMRPLSKAQLRAEYHGNTRTRRTEHLFAAAEAGDYLRVSSLIMSGVDVHAQDENGETAMLMAGWHVTSREIKKVLGCNEDDKIGCTTNHGCVVWLLARSGSDPNHRTNEGWTLLESVDSSTSASHSSPHTLSQKTNTNTIKNNIDLVTMVPTHVNHPGAGSYYFDNLFDESFLIFLDQLFESIPSRDNVDNDNNMDDGVDDINNDNTNSKLRKGQKLSSGGKREMQRSMKNTCAKRKFFRARKSHIVDTMREGLINGFSKMQQKVDNDNLSIISVPTCPLPRMRFLNYDLAGGEMKPHVDLSKTFKDKEGNVHESTHTFLLHLKTCDLVGGGETVLLESLTAGEKQHEGPRVLGSCRPMRGRLLLFPHICPHAGLAVQTAGTKLFLRGELY